VTSVIALRIEIPGYRACAALPALIDLLQHHQAGASFLFGLGADVWGRAPARRCRAALAEVRAAGFDLGILGWQPAQWIRRAATASARWINEQFSLARSAFEQVFGCAPTLTAAPGWQGNPHALRLTQRLGFACASDTRGRHPFLPVWHGEIVRCPQIPVTLPTFDELAAARRLEMDAAVSALLELSETPAPAGHVFSFQASGGSSRALDGLDRLLAGWRAQGYRIVSLQTLAGALVIDALPRHDIIIAATAGSRRPLLTQGDEFLAEWRTPQ